MPKYIVRLDDGGEAYYLEWSTVVDAPVSAAMTFRGFRGYYRAKYGRSEMGDLADRLARADAKGTSSRQYDSADALIAGNRAGLGDTCLTKEQIIDHWVRGNPLQRGTTPWEGL